MLDEHKPNVCQLYALVSNGRYYCSVMLVCMSCGILPSWLRFVWTPAYLKPLSQELMYFYFVWVVLSVVYLYARPEFTIGGKGVMCLYIFKTENIFYVMPSHLMCYMHILYLEKCSMIVQLCLKFHIHISWHLSDKPKITNSCELDDFWLWICLLCHSV